MNKSIILPMRRCVANIIYSLLFSLCTELHAQTIILDSSFGVGATCSRDLRAGIDFFIARGYVDATNGKFSNFVDFQIQTKDSNNFNDLCTASLITCVIPNPQPCYCAIRYGNIYQIVANRSAVLADSNAKIRVQWNSVDGTNVWSNVVQVPKVYDLNAVTTRLALNDAPMTCPTTVPPGSVIMFQCQKSPSPCTVSISLNDTEVAKSEHNATYTVSNDLTSRSTHNFTFSYSVCGAPANHTTCPVKIENGSVSSTTTIPGNVSSSSTTKITGSVCRPGTSTTTIIGMLLTFLCFYFVI
ncbi:unnamed protein product [Lymnaea stagnalis]|uniref:Uncharacterized protein n=1 Tax=Lymnaea stagnalis TaxID=6523 RepID=A0AAV2HES6_LYMST